MMTQFTTLSKVCKAEGALERFLASMRIFVLLLILLQTEGFRAEAAFQVFFRVVLLIMPLQTEFSFESCLTAIYVAFEDGR